MGASWDFNAIHKAITAAAADPSCWTQALDKIAAAIGAAGAALIPISISDRPLGLTFSPLAELMHGYIKEGWYKHNQRHQGLPKMRSTGITVDQDHTSLEQMRRSPFYNDRLGRYGFQWFAGVAFDAGDDNWCLAIQRSPQQGPFSVAEQRRLIALRAPMTSVATIARELGFVRALGISDAFDMIETAALLIDRHGCVVRTNKAADTKLGVESFIQSGERTVISYLVKPIRDQIMRAFRER
jgi:hypothetical protein